LNVECGGHAKENFGFTVDEGAFLMRVNRSYLEEVTAANGVPLLAPAGGVESDTGVTISVDSE
jgi:hypothetical protein